MDASVFLFLVPKVSRSQSGVAAATHAFTTERHPKMLIAAQANPAAPLLPRVNDSAVEDPIKAVSAAISINPLPIFSAKLSMSLRKRNHWFGELEIFHCGFMIRPRQQRILKRHRKLL
jgi:hypothetical protein